MKRLKRVFFCFCDVQSVSKLHHYRETFLSLARSLLLYHHQVPFMNFKKAQHTAESRELKKIVTNDVVDGVNWKSPLNLRVNWLNNCIGHLSDPVRMCYGSDASSGGGGVMKNWAMKQKQQVSKWVREKKSILIAQHERVSSPTRASSLA